MKHPKDLIDLVEMTEKSLLLDGALASQDDTAASGGGLNDLTELVDVSEESLVQLLRTRFHQDLIYTTTGPFLLAVNPFVRVDRLFGSDVLRTFQVSMTTATSSPHIYNVAANAYDAMKRTETNQSILISGESGSGKTESTKLVMEYLVHVSSHVDPVEGFRRSAHLTQHVLDANIVLESFGNARTLRNDNSSRFGKFIQLEFARQSGDLLGATIETYLLETVRVVNPSLQERNFHIFFELLHGAPMSTLAALQLVNPAKETRADAARSFRYLAQSRCLTRQDDDAKHFKALVASMTSLGLNDNEHNGIFRVLAAILHLGNVDFVATADEVQPTINSSRSISAAAALLALPLADLIAALCTRTLVVASSDVQVLSLSLQEACAARDGLAKALYSRLFEWLVDRMNARLARPRRHDHWIGLLDIFGFENVATNSFEQLCINFANEVLQRECHARVFAQEQAEYMRQGIDWRLVDVADTSSICVDFFTARPHGLFALLDDETRLAKGSDAAFAAKLYMKCLPSAVATASNVQRAKMRFIIHHYAGSVEYACVGFREKNSVAQDSLVEILCHASDMFLRELGVASTAAGTATLTSRRQASVASKFKSQLTQLLERLHDAASPHYVRCLKPNDDAVPGRFDVHRMKEQLRCNGVVAAIQLARRGYPIRLAIPDFCARFKPLVAHECASSHDVPSILDALCRRLPTTATLTSSSSPYAAFGLQLGTSKVFLQSKTHAALEAWLEQVLDAKMAVLTHAFRGYRWRRLYKQLKAMTLWCQRRFQSNHRRARAAVRVQAIFRGWRVRLRMQRQLQAATRCLAILQRRFRARRQRRIRAIVQLQAFVRGALTRRRLRGRTRILLTALEPLRPTKPSQEEEDPSCHDNQVEDDVDLLPKLQLVDAMRLQPLADFFSCSACAKRFTIFRRRLQCRACGDVVCRLCSTVVNLDKQQTRVCRVCSALHTTEVLSKRSGIWHQPWPEPPIPLNEAARLRLVESVDVRALRRNTTIQHMVTMVYHSWPGVVAVASLMGRSTQTVIAKIGKHFPDELSRDVSFCAHTVGADARVLVVLDAAKDPRFQQNPLVKGRKFRFYLGAQLTDEASGLVLGTIAVLHTTPRKTPVRDWELHVLESFARVVSDQVLGSLPLG
ncbi:hypothetical protein LEN26_019031 [Aphanomyces euteiches]|nr:hypothetical protein LEN26_019031 [Aphanomyces euteiches]